MNINIACTDINCCKNYSIQCYYLYKAFLVECLGCAVRNCSFSGFNIFFCKIFVVFFSERSLLVTKKDKQQPEQPRDLCHQGESNASLIHGRFICVCTVRSNIFVYGQASLHFSFYNNNVHRSGFLPNYEERFL